MAKKYNKKYHKRNRIAYLTLYALKNRGLVEAVLHKKRLWNILLNLYERKMKKVKLISYPYLIQLEPVCGCNLKCPLCPLGNNTIKRERGMMAYDDYVKIMQRLEDHLIHISFWNWGEPLLNKDIFRMIAYAKRKKIHTLIASNGHYITREAAKKIIESGLDEIRISLDGASEETYSKYRKNGDFNRVLESIRYLINEKNKSGKRLRVSLQFIVMRHNQHEIAEMKRISRQLNADYLSIKTVSIGRGKKGFEEFIPAKKEFSRYSFDKEGAIPKENKICYLPWKSVVVNWDGEVTACCMDFNAEHSFGNVLKQSIENIWNGEGYIRFRKAILKNRAIDICRNCTAPQERFIEE